jgi:hypothetical protein
MNRCVVLKKVPGTELCDYKILCMMILLSLSALSLNLPILDQNSFNYSTMTLAIG